MCARCGRRPKLSYPTSTARSSTSTDRSRSATPAANSPRSTRKLSCDKGLAATDTFETTGRHRQVRGQLTLTFRTTVLSAMGRYHAAPGQPLSRLEMASCNSRIRSANRTHENANSSPDLTGNDRWSVLSWLAQNRTTSRWLPLLGTSAQNRAFAQIGGQERRRRGPNPEDPRFLSKQPRPFSDLASDCEY
jgi:hypothetical protein